MDRYFENFKMTEEDEFELARFSLILQASEYWWKIEKSIKHRHEVPVTTWKELKYMLRHKYFPWSYHQKILDQWSRLTQGTSSVLEYITNFDEFVRRDLVNESERMIISWFKAGLREDIKRELFHWETHYLEDAYQIARDFEAYQKELLISRSKPNRNDTSGHRISSSQVPSNKPTPIIPVICKEEIYEPIEEPEVEIYEADPALVDEYERQMESELELEPEPIKPLDNCPEELDQDKGDLGDEKELESSDPLAVIEPDLDLVTTGKSDGHMSKGDIVRVLTNEEMSDQEHPQEVVSVLILSDPPNHLPPLRNISIPSWPSWDVHHAFTLVPVIFESYVLRTLWHSLGTQGRFTSTYLKLCARVP